LRAGTPSAFRGYLQGFATGVHSAEARRRIAAAEDDARKKEEDDKAWADATKAGTADAFKAYLQKYGSGSHAGEARQRIAELDAKARVDADEKAWSEATRLGTTSAYNSYLSTSGNLAHASEARQRLAALASQERRVPTVDIRKTCRDAAAIMVSLLGGATTEQSVNACLESEKRAREQIVKDHGTFSAADIGRCLRPGVYLPSYVEWLTCLEMERDVRQMQQQQFRQNPAGSAAPIGAASR